jgi:hypothetical protein
MLSKRKTIRVIVALVTLLIATPFVLFFVYIFTSGGEGSLAVAQQLKLKLESIPSPEAGKGSDFEYFWHRFPDGEWMIGISRDSHGFFSKYRGGGTVVFKDSRGAIRCYFGHCCGALFPKVFAYDAKTLDRFLESMQESGMVETDLP